MSRVLVMLAIAGCSIPDASFKPSPDADTAIPTVLAIVPSQTAVEVDEGATRDFTVRLSLAPSGPLTVQAATASDKIGVSPGELTFTPTDFAQEQTVTVTGFTDVDTAIETVAVDLTAADVDPVSVAATVRDLDTVQIITDIQDNLVTVNEQGSATVRVHLSARPTGEVRVSALVGAGPVTITPDVLVFSPEEYDVDQELTVTSADDSNVVSETVALTLRAQSVLDQLATIRSVDNDTVNIHLSDTSVGVDERGSVRIGVFLTSEPATEVVVNVTVASSSVGVSPTVLRFTPQNFATVQDLDISAPDDIDTAGGSDVVRLEASGVDPQQISVAISDDDVQRIVIENDDPPSPFPVTEDVETSFTATLAFQPTGNLDVAVSSLNTAIVTAVTTTVRFTPDDYDQPHTIRIRGAADNNLATNVSTIRLREVGSQRQTDLSVAVADDDQQRIVLSTSTLNLAEGQTGTFGVSLAFDPGTTVTIALANTNADEVPFTIPQPLQFTSSNFSTPKLVNVTPDVDTDATATSAVITASGATAPVTPTVTVTVTDPTIVKQFGFFNSFLPSAETAAAGEVIAYKVTVGEVINLDAFGVIVSSPSGDFRMALYDGVNAPGNLIAQMAVRKTLNDGISIGDISNVQINGPATFWIALRVSADTAVGYAPTQAQTGTLCLRNTNIISLNDPWPATFGNSSCSSERLMNFFINTFRQP